MLTADLNLLLDTLDAADFDPPRDLAAALDALPPAGTLPVPHVTWTVFALARYDARMRWAHEAVHSLLAPTWARDHGGQPLGKASGRAILPGRPGWEVELECGDCYVVHRATRERVHVDLLNPPGDFTSWRLVQYLREHRSPGPAARRVLELHPGCRALPPTLDALAAAGALHEVDDDEFSLCGLVSARAASLDAFLDLWEGLEPAERVWPAALVGDWPAAHDAALAVGDPGLVDRTGRRAEACRRRRIDALRATEEIVGFRGGRLHALADAGAPDLSRRLEEALRQPYDAAAEALEVIAADPAYVPAVEALYERALAGDFECHPLTTPCAAYLARHGDRPGEVIEALLGTTWGREPAEAALLALQHAPELTLRLMREALRTPIINSRLTAAAALALVDRPWSRRELRAVLDESDDPGATSECLAALRRSRDPESRRAADAWEASHAGDGDVAGPSVCPLYDRPGGCERALSERMDELRDRLLEVREPRSDDGAGSTAPPP